MYWDEGSEAPSVSGGEGGLPQTDLCPLSQLSPACPKLPLPVSVLRVCSVLCPWYQHDQRKQV